MHLNSGMIQILRPEKPFLTLMQIRGDLLEAGSVGEPGVESW